MASINIIDTIWHAVIDEEIHLWYFVFHSVGQKEMFNVMHSF